MVYSNYKNNFSVIFEINESINYKNNFYFNKVNTTKYLIIIRLKWKINGLIRKILHLISQSSIFYIEKDSNLKNKIKYNLLNLNSIYIIENNCY